MLENAIKKLKAEMEANKSNAYIQNVGQYLIEYLGRQPDDAVNIMVDGKTIAKSLAFMRDEAKKQSGGGSFAVITPEQGYGIVMKYYDINNVHVPPAIIPKAAETVPEPVTKSIQVPAPAAAKSSIDFDISLDDLL